MRLVFRFWGLKITFTEQDFAKVLRGSFPGVSDEDVAGVLALLRAIAEKVGKA